jgi:signal transduction histidine kinase
VHASSCRGRRAREAYAKQSGGAVEVVAPEEVRIAIDAATIQQVVMNLIVNAIQATPPGGDPVTVEIVPAREMEPPAGEGRGVGPYVAVRVIDHGSGIAPVDLAHIFEPFFTTKDVGEGTGLGLSVSYGIVQDHGGWISATSSRGAPTVFEVNLPAFRGPESLLPGPPRDSSKGRMPAAGARA